MKGEYGNEKDCERVSVRGGRGGGVMDEEAERK